MDGETREEQLIREARERVFKERVGFILHDICNLNAEIERNQIRIGELNDKLNELKI